MTDKKNIYGLVGKGLTHSHSPEIHKMLGGYDFSLFDMEEDQFEAFMEARDFDGISITMPYKVKAMDYCDQLTDTARRCGCVNTVVKRKGRLLGENTDYYGLRYLIEKNAIEMKGRDVVVFGTGGAGRMACALAEDMGAYRVTNVGRSNPAANYKNLKKHMHAHVFINATPCGMYPNNGDYAVDISSYKECHSSCEAAIDLIYNPLETMFMRCARGMGVRVCGGLDMLVGQAIKGSSMFLGEDIPGERADAASVALRRKVENVCLIGMPGSGKTTVGQVLAIRLGKRFVDTDVLLKERTGLTPAQIIVDQGEPAFRKLEFELIKEVTKEGGQVIATGGGCVTQPGNLRFLKQNGPVVYLKRDLGQLAMEDRPLSSKRSLKHMMKDREPAYRFWSDITVENVSIAEAVEEIATGLGY